MRYVVRKIASFGSVAVANSRPRLRIMCYESHHFCNLGMSETASGDEFMYDPTCITEGAGCGKRGVVRHHGLAAT